MEVVLNSKTYLNLGESFHHQRADVRGSSNTFMTACESDCSRVIERKAWLSCTSSSMSSAGPGDLYDIAASGLKV